MRLRPFTSLASVFAVVLAMCSACGGSRPTSGAFRERVGFSASWQVTTGDYINLGVPSLDSVTDQPVRMLSVHLAVPSDRIKVSYAAYTFRKAKAGVLGELGNLPMVCPGRYKPSPVTSFVAPGKGTAPWFIVMTLRVPKPGTYQLGPVSLTYSLDGHRQTEIEPMNTKLMVKRGRAAKLGKHYCEFPPRH